MVCHLDSYQNLPPWYPHTFLEQALLRLVNEAIRHSGVAPTDFAVLDVGSGRGEMMKHLRAQGITVSGVDVDPQCVELSGTYGPSRLANIEVEDVGLPDEYDLVLCSHVLEHLQNPAAAIERLKKTSRQWLVLAVPNSVQLITLPHYILRLESLPQAGHLCCWNRGHFISLVERHCGLRIVTWEVDSVVVLYPRRLRQLRKLLYKLKLLHLLEAEIVPFLLPWFATSLIVLCEVPRTKGTRNR